MSQITLETEDLSMLSAGRCCAPSNRFHHEPRGNRTATVQNKKMLCAVSAVKASKHSGGILVHVAGEVCVQSFVTRDELIGESEPRHEATLLQPEDGTEASTEEDPLYTSKCYHPLCKRIITAEQPQVRALNCRSPRPVRCSLKV